MFLQNCNDMYAYQRCHVIPFPCNVSQLILIDCKTITIEIKIMVFTRALRSNWYGPMRIIKLSFSFQKVNRIFSTDSHRQVSIHSSEGLHGSFTKVLYSFLSSAIYTSYLLMPRIGCFSNLWNENLDSSFFSSKLSIIWVFIQYIRLSTLS